MLLELKSLDSGYGFLQVLWDVSLHVEEGEFVALIGPNGAGKSTTLKTISGLVEPQGAGRAPGLPQGRRLYFRGTQSFCEYDRQGEPRDGGFYSQGPGEASGKFGICI